MDKDEVCIYNRVLLGHKREILQLVTTQTSLEGIILNEINLKKTPRDFTKCVI